MSRFNRSVALVSWILLAGPSLAQEHHDQCSYSLVHNGPTWNSARQRIPYNVIALAWARDGAYGGSGSSVGTGFRLGGAAVAVANLTYWFRLTHNPIPGCEPVQFDSEASLEAEVATTIAGDSDDYALSAGFQAVTGKALQAASVAVAATNAGSPVQNSVLSISFGIVNFTVTIPGVSVTGDTVDSDSNSASTWGNQKTEEELMSFHCWTKTKVVTNGPFGGTATAHVEKTRAYGRTFSICPTHQVSGEFTCEAIED